MLRSTLFFCAASLASGASWITSGVPMFDTAGNQIDAHGFQIIQRGNIFYWIGHNRAGSATVDGDVTPNLYSSTDLLNWDFVGQPAAAYNAVWRPKIAKPNGNFFIYGQQDRLVLGLKSSSIDQGYRQNSKTGIPPNNVTYSDTGIFLDEVSNTWYLLTSAQSNVIAINVINADGTIGSRASSLLAGALEAPGIFRAGDTYFLIVSGKTGYRHNPNKVYWSKSMSGPWVGGTDIAPPAENTYQSQNTHELTIKGTQQTTYIYLGDRWVSGGGLASTYVLLPIIVDVANKNVTLEWHDRWRIDVKTGVVTYPTTKKRYEAEFAELTGKSLVKKCESCLSGRSVHKVSGPSEVTFQNVQGTGALQWFSIHYKVNKPHLGDAYLIINDKQTLNISSLNSNAGHRNSVPVQLKLDSGDNNKITFGAFGDDFEVEVDGLEIFEDDFEL